jgi:uncharacterized protein YjiS (DUF1127 family)
VPAADDSTHVTTIVTTIVSTTLTDDARARRGHPSPPGKEQTDHTTEYIMSTISNAARRHSAAGGGLLHALGTALRGSWAAYMARRQQHLAVAKLQSMSDHQLKDIGLSRSQIESAVRGSRDRVPFNPL